MGLPNEIVLSVMSYLSNTDLKNVRLVSESWSACASEFLFEKIYISSQKEDVDVFTAISKNILLSRRVKTLEFDAVVFTPNYTEDMYLERLWEHIASIAGTLSRPWTIYDSPDAQINEFVEMTRRSLSSATNVDTYQAHQIAKCKDFVFVKEGYRNCIERASYEEAILEDGKFLAILIEGLNRFQKLENVYLKGTWYRSGLLSTDSTIPTCRNGSTLRRTWDLFRCPPLHWNSASDANGAAKFRVITQALARSERKIRTLDCACGVPPEVFQMSSAGINRTDTLHHNDLYDAYSRLEHLTIKLASYSEGFASRPGRNLDKLGLQLHSMRNVRWLNLNLPEHKGDDPRAFVAISQMFPSTKLPYWSRTGERENNILWPNLTRLYLSNISISLCCWIYLLHIATPNLRWLYLHNVWLKGGSWDSIFELLKYQARLKTLDICDATSLFYGRGDNFLREHCALFPEAIARYVVEGRDDAALKHPSLGDDQLRDESQLYLQEARRELERTSLNPKYSDRNARAAKVIENAIEAARRSKPTIMRQMRFQLVQNSDKSGFYFEKMQGDDCNQTADEIFKMLLERFKRTGALSATCTLELL